MKRPLTLEQMDVILADKLYIGKKVRVDKWEFLPQGKGKEAKVRNTRKGTVVGIYPYIFMVDFGNSRECFRKSQIFETDGERVILS